MERDTAPSQQAKYHELLRRLTPAERLRITSALVARVRRMAVAGIRSRHPAAGEAEVSIRLAVRLYGREVTERLYGSVPDDAI